MTKSKKSQQIVTFLSIISLAALALFFAHDPASVEAKPPGGGGGGNTPPLPSYEMEFLGSGTGSGFTSASAMNNYGDVVGSGDEVRGAAGRSWSFGYVSYRATDGSRTVLNLQDYFESLGLLPVYDYDNPIGHARVQYALDINDAGQILVAISIAGGGGGTYLFTPPSQDDPGSPRLVLIPGGAGAINNSGHATGYINETGEAFVWSETNGLFSLGHFDGRTSWGRDINSVGQVAGMNNPGYRAWRWTPGSGFKSLGAPKGKHGISAGHSINDNGDVAGQTYNGFNSGIFRYTDAGGFKELGHLGGNWSEGGRINSQGAVVASSKIASGEFHICLYTDATGLFDVNTRIINLPTGSSIREAGINNAGEICGTITYADGTAEPFVLTSIVSL